ncbi:MAG TPA: hypothetical protein VH092_20555 [Urbifossiella sp.]|jgi:hypothetical protein|nr:hypothetical protein [Urbifossiella sp.]
MASKINDEIETALAEFGEGCGFGDPDARRNAELRLQVLLARQQGQTAHRMNQLTFLLVLIGLMQVAVVCFQVWGK